MNDVKFSVINGSPIRVGHCIHRYDCNIPACVGTDCQSYKPTNPDINKYTVINGGAYNFTKEPLSHEYKNNK